MYLFNGGSHTIIACRGHFSPGWMLVQTPLLTYTLKLLTLLTSLVDPYFGPHLHHSGNYWVMGTM